MASEALVLPEFWTSEREWTQDLDWKFNKQTGEHDQSFYLTDAQEIPIADRLGRTADQRDLAREVG